MWRFMEGMTLVTICLKHEGVSQQLRKKAEEGKDGAEPCQRCCCSRENCPEWALSHRGVHPSVMSSSLRGVYWELTDPIWLHARLQKR